MRNTVGIFEDNSPDYYDKFGNLIMPQQVEHMQVPTGRDQLSGGVSFPYHHCQTAVAYFFLCETYF